MFIDVSHTEFHIGKIEMVAGSMIQSLCETCHWMREVRTARSRFLLCELSITSPDFPKYPPQPVVQCGGYRSKDGAETSRPGDSPGRPT
jgi:hypothetical protein